MPKCYSICSDKNNIKYLREVYISRYILGGSEESKIYRNLPTKHTSF
jgi:hypothetical protein